MPRPKKLVRDRRVMRQGRRTRHAQPGAPCCCPGCWRQAFHCADDAPTGRWARCDQVPPTLDPIFYIDGGCVYFGPSQPTPGGPGRIAPAGTTFAGCTPCNAPECDWQSGYPTSVTYTIIGTQSGCCFEIFVDVGGATEIGRRRVTGNIDGTYNLPTVLGFLGRPWGGEAVYPCGISVKDYKGPFDDDDPADCTKGGTLLREFNLLRLLTSYEPGASSVPGYSPNLLYTYATDGGLVIGPPPETFEPHYNAQGPVYSPYPCRKGPLDPLGATFEMPDNSVLACTDVFPNQFFIYGGTVIATYHWGP